MGSMGYEIDIIPFLCEAVAFQPSAYQLVEEIYQENEYEYYELAKSSKWYKDNIITSLSMEKEMIAKKALGIFLKNESKDILRIIEKGWPQIFQWNNRTAIDSYELFEFMLPDDQSKWVQSTDEQRNAWTIITIFMGILDGATNESNYMLREYLYLRLNLAQEKSRGLFINLPKQKQTFIKNLKLKVYKSIGKNPFLPFYQNCSSSDAYKFYLASRYLFNTETRSESLLEEDSLHEKDINEIFAAYYAAFNNLNSQEAAKFYATGIVIKRLLRAYRQLKEEYWSTVGQLFSELKKAKDQNEFFEDELTRLRIALDKKEREVVRLQKEHNTDINPSVTNPFCY
jgi:hypothetical protein